MSWKNILKAHGCGCDDCNEVSKGKEMSSAGFRGGSRRQPMRGSTLDSQSYLACIDRLNKKFGMGGMSEEQYMEERDRCKAKFGM